MKHLKSKYIQHLTPGLIFKSNINYIYCVVNNNKVLYTYCDGNGTVILVRQDIPWLENYYYKLVLADKKLSKKFKL